MKIGVIGAGKMGTAIIQGMLRQPERFAPEEIRASRRHPEACEALAALGVTVTADNLALAEWADAVILAVKPHFLRGVLCEIREALHGKAVLSIAAGWTYEMLEEALPADAEFVRAMPNLPLTVGEGMTLLAERRRCGEETFALCRAVFEAAGEVAVVDERVFLAANGITGCGPAFAFLFIEALADGAVRCGTPRAMAYEMAAQMLIGAAKMVKESGQHPGALKDAVCSPGGSTIEGVLALEEGGFRASVIHAVGATVEKTLQMARENA